MKYLTRKHLLAAILFASFAPLHAENSSREKIFTARGMEPFWTLEITPQSDSAYSADFSTSNGAKFTAPVTLVPTSRFGETLQMYQGTSPYGEVFSIVASATPCQAESTGDNYSHAVVVTADKLGTYEGCGGKRQSGDTDTEKKATKSKQIKQKQPIKPVNPAREKAKKLNTQGYRLYKQGKYDKALPLFVRALKADDSYALAQYNLACTAAIGFEKFSCEQEELFNTANPDTVFKALKQAIKNNPERLVRSQTDPDLANIRKSYRYYREILGYSPSNDKQLQIMLEKVDWQSTGMRLYHTEPAVRLKFLANGQLRVKIAHFIEDEIPENSLPWRYTYQNGRYIVKNGTILLIINGKKISGKLSNEGTLTFTGASDGDLLPADTYRYVWDTPCEA